MLKLGYIRLSLLILTLYWAFVYFISINTTGHNWFLTTLGSDFVSLARSGDIPSYLRESVLFSIRIIAIAFFLVNAKSIFSIILKKM